jgi:hypothetical protein
MLDDRLIKFLYTNFVPLYVLLKIKFTSIV